MRKHLRYRLMGFMMALVVLVMIFVGVMLFTNIAMDYNRAFYNDMTELQSIIELFEVNEGNLEDLVDFLPTQDSLNPLLTDRTYYILQQNTILYSNIYGGPVKKTDNLRQVLNGGTNRQAGAFAETLDFAWNLRDGHTLYVVDHRTGLMDDIRNYLLLFIQALLIGIVLTVAVSFLLARQFLIPIQKLIIGAKAMQLTGEFKEIPTASKDEVGELTRVFNAMGTRITKNFQMLQDLLRNIPKPLFAINQQGTIVHSNEAFKLLFEQPPLKSIFMGHDQETRFMAEIDGRFFCVYRSMFLLGDGSEGTLFLLDDITEAESLENERKQFVANVSHELKTPLTVIKSYSETMLESELDEPTRRRFLQTVERSADQMNAMVNQLLELSKTEAAPRGHLEPLDLAAAAREVCDAMQLEFKKKELQCLTRLPPRRELLCEPDQVRRVMVNLLSNSIKYSNPGGKVTVTVENTPGGVLFSVADEGIGIEKKHIPHLFDKFYRVDKARSRETGGTGLGLSIVHSIVTGMGGRVTVDSTFGKGSTFTCYFPD
ncbi:MAG: HAMP domain-containing protein [Clostridia bacterium]|nr:HAMP domain-containing protein [Clostridia bacterium]